MALRKYSRDNLETEREEKLIRYLDDLVDHLNKILFSHKADSKNVDGRKLIELTDSGMYYGVNKNDDGFPPNVKEYSLLVVPTENGVAQVLFSNRLAEFKVYSRCVIDGKTSSWKEL